MEISPHASATEERESKMVNSVDVVASIRDLMVHLSRRNGAQAELVVVEVVACLKGIMLSGEDPASSGMQRAQQTMFAIDEVRTLLSQQDYDGAAAAARDAAKEWRQGSSGKTR